MYLRARFRDPDTSTLALLDFQTRYLFSNLKIVSQESYRFRHTCYTRDNDLNENLKED